MSKISLIGAGSVVFAKKLICDILASPGLEGSTICLMDIDARRLEVARMVAEKVVTQMGVPARIEATLDLRSACRGAKYAITMMQVGGYSPATVTDFEIPKKYGLRQTIGDTLGIGGIFRALRTIPALVGVGRALASVGAESPLLLNYSNPMAMSMMGLAQLCGVPAVGLCHSVQHTSRQLADYAGLDPEQVTYRVAGINHVAFFLEFRYRGQDAYPLLFDAMENPAIFARDRVRFEMLRRLGYFVTESSEHFAEYCPWFIAHGEETIRKFGIPIDEYLRRCESILSTWKKTEKKMLKGGRISMGQSVEYGSTILHSIETGAPSVVYGNVINTGLITNLPDGCCVEVPCLVDSQGLQPTIIGDLPPQLAAMCQSNINVQELTVHALVTGKREHIYHAAMMDPSTASQLRPDQIWKMCDEMIDAHQKHGFLPAFQPVRTNTGRSSSSLEVVDVGVEEVFGSDGRRFELVICNRQPRKFSGSVSIVVDKTYFAVEPHSRIAVNVAPGDVSRHPFSVRRLRGGKDLEIDLVCPRKGVFKRGFHLPERQSISLKSPATLSIDWSGNDVATGSLEKSKDSLCLKLRVNDSNIQTFPEAFWEASVLEFFFARDGRATPSQVIVLPDPKKPRVAQIPGLIPVPGAQAKVRADRAGYDVEVLLTLNSLGLENAASFLMEMIVRVSALGDAHGNVSATWQGSKNPVKESSRYANIVF